MSHEISESFNDPFLNNITPRWQFGGGPGVCRRNLETGDPVEVLAHPFPVTLPPANRGAGAMVHPDIDGASDAFGGAFSYPGTTALPGSALPCTP